MPNATLYTGDAKETLRDLPESSVQTCVTSPPYWGLRDYGVDGQLGLEEMPEEYVNNLCDVFDEVRRVLRDDGTLWLNLGDSYNSNQPDRSGNHGYNDGRENRDKRFGAGGAPGLKEKDLTMIPSRVAMELQRRGWWVRSRIVWAKGNPMPESVTDRPTSSHEYIFLLSKSKQYYYDADAIREDYSEARKERAKYTGAGTAPSEHQPNGESKDRGGATLNEQGRKKRDVWQVNTKPFPDAHFAVYPPQLIEPCIKAGTSKKGQCPECGAPWERVVEKEESTVRRKRGTNQSHHAAHDSQPQRGEILPGERETTGWQPTCNCDAGDPKPQTVLDPFSGAGTSGVVALAKGRHYIGIDLSREYNEMAAERIRKDAPLMNDVQTREHAYA